MARTKGRRKRKGGTSAYFRQIFSERPDLLHGTSNQELITRWMADHPNHKPIELRKAKANLANLKSLLRKEEREGRGGKTAPQSVRTGAATRGLDALEEAIDDCLSYAKSIDRTQLESVIKLLRRARNAVVWKIGSSD
jgi:hypothetical protein